MKKPDIPDNEQRRLEALRALNVLDTAAEERFDRVTRMAKRLFNVPIALVSLVDENRQWFKSCVGLDASETGRDISFCGHAILDDETFYITDASYDERFSDNPLVTGPPYIRFYAGHPLKAPGGEKIGTLCIIDSFPRAMSENDLTGLKDLASMVEQELATLQLATMDELTDISNRRGFALLADHSLNISRRQEIPMSLVFFDLNRFKLINDEYGHAEGDRALIIFATQIKESFRDSDIFGRLGGDEFSVLLMDSDKKLAEHLVNNFSNTLRETILSNQLRYSIEFSFGVAEFNEYENSSIESLINCADQAMYKNKKRFKGLNKFRNLIRLKA